MQHTPGLDVEGHDGLGSDLGLGSLLLTVGSEALLANAFSLGILLLVAAEQVDVVVVVVTTGLLRSLGGVDRHLGDLGAVGSVGLGGIAREGGELALVGSDVAVPPSSVGVLLGVRGLGEGLEGGDISLRGGVAVRRKLAALSPFPVVRQVPCSSSRENVFQRCTECLLLRQSACLKRL